MPLVELVPGECTSAAAIDRCATMLEACDKVPVRLQRDYPGFLWNRIQIAVLREAKHLVDAGVADAATVDLVVQQGLARRWSVTGPLASAVLGGLPTFEAVGRNLLPLLSDARDLDGMTAALDGYVPDPVALDRTRNQRLAAMPEGTSA
jgi:3-hydroxybutyryl-CoA dehydrogenase